MCFCCRQLLLFVWSQYQRSESYNFLMCPLTTEPTCLISCRCVCVCVSEPHCFPWDVWFHAALPTFLFPLPVSCCHFTPINTHMCMCTHTHTQSGGVNSRKSTTSFDQTRGPSSVWWLFVWHPALLSDSLQTGWGEGGLEAASLGPEWTAEDAGVPKRTIPLLNIQQLLSSSVRSWLYQFLVQTAAPQGSGVWSCKAVLGTVTQRSLKIWEELVSVWDRMSGMEWGCKTIYGSLWLLCKHGSDERKENRGGQRSHDSETGGGVRIRKAVMITDQSKPPEAGARQVVYTHMH